MRFSLINTSLVLVVWPAIDLLCHRQGAPLTSNSKGRSCVVKLTRNSAKLTNQRVNCAFTSSPLSLHVRYILPTLYFAYNLYRSSSSIVILVFYLFSTDISEQHVQMWELFTGLTLPLRGTPVNNPITPCITSKVPGLHFLPLTVYA